MKDWLQTQIDSNFADFKGLSISAQIPMKDRLVNDMIAQFLQGGASTPPGKAPDIKGLLKFVQKAEVHASDGVIAIDVVISI